MSLLNDALRDLEKREGAGEDGQASVPAGLKASGYRTPRYWRWTVGGMALLLAVVAGTGFWWFGGGDPGPGGQGALPAMEPEPSPVLRTVSPEPEPRASETTPETTERTPSSGTQSAGTVDRTVAPAPEDSGDENDAQRERAADPGESGETAAALEPEQPETDSSEQPEEPSSQESTAADQPAPDTEPETATVRELTPAEKDRRLARELEELLADGRVAQAEERLRQRVMLDSDAPRSRAVMAGDALARENPGAALQWLPEEAVAMYPRLRLLRARVALAREGRTSALGWLESEPPGPSRLPAYHTMMAALYQQTGNHDAAAEQWAALIETDDSNARWWAGLGIAMEAQGRDERARTAYSQALSLPDLAPQLRRYIEQRLAAGQG